MGGTFRQAVSTHAKAVRLQQASLQLARVPGSAVTSHVSRAGRPTVVPAPTTKVTPQPATEATPRWARANAHNREHLSRRTAASSYGDQGHGSRPASDSAESSVNHRRMVMPACAYSCVIGVGSVAEDRSGRPEFDGSVSMHLSGYPVAEVGGRCLAISAGPTQA